MARLDRHLAAICVPMHPDRLVSALAANDGSATGSSYTEAGPRPGATTPQNAKSRLVPVISGGLGQDLELVTIKGGTPALALTGDAEVGYRLAGEASEAVRGWNIPNWVTGCWTTISPAACTASDVTTIPGTQTVLVAYGTSTGVYVRTYDTSQATDSWTSAVQVTDTASVANLAVLALPTGRLLLLAAGDAYRSDDGGATWALHSENCVPGVTSYGRCRMAYAAGTILIMFWASGTVMSQRASADDLSSSEIVGIPNTIGTSPSVVGLPSGAFAVSYIKATTALPQIKIISSAYQSLDDVTAIEVDADDGDDLTLTMEPDGLLWIHMSDAQVPGRVRLYVSVDSALTWTETDSEAIQLARTMANDYLTSLGSTSAAGSTFLLATPVATSSGMDECLVVRLGGHSNVALREGGGGNGLASRLGCGAGQVGQMYLPIEYPQDLDLNWVRTNAGTPTLSLLATGFYMSTDVTTDTNSYAASIFDNLTYCAEFGVRLIAGGSSTANEVVARIQCADGVDEYLLSARLYISGGTVRFLVRDAIAATTLATVNTGVAAGDLLRLFLHNGGAGDSRIWYCTTSTGTDWTLAWSGSLTSDTGSPAATGEISWGHVAAPASAAAESVWAYVSGVEPTGGVGYGTADAGYATPVVGRPCSVLPVPLPGCEGIDDPEGRVPWLSVAAGPGALGEVHDAPADHDHPVEHLIPTVSPSPSETWRGTAGLEGVKAEEIIAWDFGALSLLGDVLALPVLNANFQSCYLEYYDGAAWQTAGTYDGATGFNSGGLTYILAGEVLTPGASSIAGGRYIQEGEVAGGYIIVETGAGTGTRALRVKWNSAGVWGPSSTSAPKVRIWIDQGDLDGSEDATGDAILVWPSGVLAVVQSAALPYRRWRIRIPADQVTPDDYYEAGIAVPMAVRTLGAAPDWGWSKSVAPNSETRTSRYGTTRTRRLGPPIESWTLAWTSGVDLYGLRASAGPDYLGPSGSYASGGTAAEDVPWLLSGVLDQIDSGAVPVVALASVPDATTTITDRSLYLYGRLTSSVRQDHVVGDDGEDEVVRVASIDINGIV